jgi:hypothetical protein
MAALTASKLLNVWERGFSQMPAEQALTLLHASVPELSFDAIASLPVGERDASLLRLREALWGPQMVAVAPCPRCSEGLDLTLSTEEILLGASGPREAEYALRVDGFFVRFRPPTGEDLISLTPADSPEAAAAKILQQCLISAHRGAKSIGVSDFPPSLVDAIDRMMAESDPLAEIRLNLSCPACGHCWFAPLDIVSFLWSELDAWARRTLRDVHTLARAYGWREQDILALSSTRRHFYLGLVNA